MDEQIESIKAMIRETIKVMARINARLEAIEEELGIEEEYNPEFDDDIPLATVLEFAKK